MTPCDRKQTARDAPEGNDRRPSHGVYPPFLAGGGATSKRETRGCGNAGPMENHKTISTGPWKSRTEREIPTFPQADSAWFRRKKTKARRMNRLQTESLPERRTGLFSERGNDQPQPVREDGKARKRTNDNLSRGKPGGSGNTVPDQTTEAGRQASRWRRRRVPPGASGPVGGTGPPLFRE